MTKDGTKGEKQRWLQEVEGIMRRLHKVGTERIPAEFKELTEHGVVVWLRDQNKTVAGGHVGERLGVIVDETDKPLVLGFSDASTKENLWKKGNGTRYHARSWEEFVSDLIPFDLDWLYSAWRRGLDYSYLMIEDKKITGKTMQQCANQEIRKYLLKRFGQEKFRNGEAKVIDETKDGDYLFEIEFDNAPHRFVKVTDSSKIKNKKTIEALGSDRREYMLEVPAIDEVGQQDRWNSNTTYPINTVHNARAWTFGYKNPKDFHPEKET